MSNEALRDCKHGQLARSCNICELEAEVTRLQAENDKLRAANNLAPHCLEDIFGKNKIDVGAINALRGVCK